MKAKDREEIKAFWRSILKREGRIPQEFVDSFKATRKTYRKHNWRKEIEAQA